MVYHVTILAGKMIENKASHDTQRVFHDLSRAVEYCHYYHKEKKTAKKNKQTNKQTKGRRKTKIKKKEKEKKTPTPTPSPRFTDTRFTDGFYVSAVAVYLYLMSIL